MNDMSSRNQVEILSIPKTRMKLLVASEVAFATKDLATFNESAWPLNQGP